MNNINFDNDKQFNPFDSIGLCFSGGGYRATFFSLGVLSYLDNIKYGDNSLLDNVEAISTVSGGTLVGVAYSKAVYSSGYEFKSFYKDFYSAFKPKNDKLLKNAISKLKNDSIWLKRPHKKRSLINAFSLTYADMDLFKGDFKLFENTESTKLKHVCFNATDFSFGLAFRFQNTGRLGNKPLNCTELSKIKNEIQLSDVIASSSCFPLGFEPLVFPDDFFKNNKSKNYKALKRQEKFINGVGIMDGGITDNQGIGSMVNISKLKERKKPLDLIIVNDVGSYKMIPWQAESSKISSKKSLKDSILGILNYFSIRWVYWVILAAGVLFLVLNSFQIIKQTAWSSLYILGGLITGVGITLIFLGLFASLAKIIGISWFKSMFKKKIPEVLIDDVVSFQYLDVSLIKRMLTERATSTVKLVNDVFLKQIRRLNYDLIYSSKDLHHKIITSTVYELNGKNTPYRKNDFNENIKPIPSETLRKIALTASETPTTLWWDEKDIKKDRMRSLIACGQFTTCYNLINHILKLKQKGIHSTEIEKMYKELVKDWKEFNKDPQFMIEAEL